MPPYVAVPYASSIGLRPGYFGANYLGLEHNPFESDGDPNAANFTVNNLNLASGLSVQRLEDRRGLLNTIDSVRRAADESRAFDTLDRFQQKAFELVVGEAGRKAFDLSQEDAALRDRYGRNTWARARCLRGVWSRRVRRLLPCTSVAGIITGICRKAWKITCPKSMRVWQRCLRTSAIAAFSTTCWSCFAVNSVERPR